MSGAAAQLDEAARAAVYGAFIEAGAAPEPGTLAARLGVTPAELAASYRRLEAQRALVLDAAGAIAMAIPFAATPTDVRVDGEGVRWWANCAFDGLGIPALLGRDAVVTTACPESGAAIRIVVAGGAPGSVACVLHMAVPLARWWDNIGDT